ncbi:hypothetical protein Taro_005385 [Colocasia esculenta]|uniref:Homeobox domain-containing protein n=1 Tax=Colocasia esculenta TaxID=4460 RepID=A0A843TUE2_COLES|nr:hypothetical protein [Colocasia esculenta]
MASSNRHWPSLFKSKACNAHHQGHHDMINSSTLLSASQKPSYTSGILPGCEERSPEPKPRWNPKPEQIRILEAIFNSGMVNPPRDEIRRIRAQLQEYGQVGDANVFYWFQNRKCRSKQKQRHLQAARLQQPRNPTGNAAPPRLTVSAATTSSSSSSERASAGSDSAGSDKTVLHGTTTVSGVAAAVDVSNSPTASVNQNFLHGDIFPEPFYFQANTPQSCCLSAADFPGLVVPEHALGLCAGLFSVLRKSWTTRTPPSRTLRPWIWTLHSPTHSRPLLRETMYIRFMYIH